MRELLGTTVNGTLKRNYGPYLNSKPILPAGEYSATIQGISNTGKGYEIAGLNISYKGYTYYIDAKDWIAY